MATNLTLETGSGFRIQRPGGITTNGFVGEVNADIQAQLEELNQILGKRIFQRENPKAQHAKGTLPGGGANPPQTIAIVPPITDLLGTPPNPKQLTPKRIPAAAANSWDPNSIAAAFNAAPALPDPMTGLTLSDYIDTTAELSALKYAFQSNLSDSLANLDFNTQTVLGGYSAISDFLIAYGYFIMGLTEVNGLSNFILKNKLGTKSVVNYAVVGAARVIVDREQLIVPDINKDNSTIVTSLETEVSDAENSLSDASFYTDAKAVINDDIFNGKYSKLLEDAIKKGFGAVPSAIKPQLIQLIKNSPVIITDKNIDFFLPLFISQIVPAPTVTAPAETDTTQSDKDFDVDFIQDDTGFVQISVSAVKCAAQLYYGMTVGDELDVFNIANYFTHKYLVRGGINIEDSQLRQDLQNYVFSNRFTDLKTGRLVDRTRPAERQMFYRQVFNAGSGKITEDVIVNTEFPRLWKVLILESAKYLEKRQTSFNLDSISPQNVQQAVEDLQYNLSTHCTGMANVVSPIIYAELNFVIQRIFMHKEIIQQIVPAGGTWWRVVETLYMGLKNTRPKATVLYNKAKLGFDIIRSIAEYDPKTFALDSVFSAFISNVDAFITTQSILQEALTDDLKKGDSDDDAKGNGAQKNVPAAPEAPVAAGAKTGSDDWDF